MPGRTPVGAPNRRVQGRSPGCRRYNETVAKGYFLASFIQI
jgi:hypothetical protein